MSVIIRKYFLPLLALAFAIGGIGFPAFAADDRVLPERATTDLTQEPQTPESKFSKEIARSLRQKKPEISVEEEEKKPLPEEAGPEFFVKEIVLDGNHVIPTKELQPFIDPLKNKKATFREVTAAAQLITNYYRAAGFITSRAYVPPQKIAKDDPDQVVTIKILEGKVGAIRVEGNRYFKASSYADVIRFPRDGVFALEDLQASLIQLNQNADRAAKAYIEQGTLPETSDILLKAEDHYPVHVAYEFNNRGTNLTHYARNEISITNNNFLGYGDQFYNVLSLAESNALTAWNGQYTFPLEKTATVLSLGGSYSKSRLIGSLKPYEIKGTQWSITPGIEQFFVRTLRYSLSGFFGFEFKDSRSDLGNKKMSLDQNRVLRFGPRLIANDAWGRTFLNSDFHIGIPDLMGGSSKGDPNASRVGSGGQFFYLTGSLARLLRLPKEAILILKTSGQWSVDPLNSLEQFRAGGAFSVRGYPESDSTGDSGYLWSSELRLPPYFVPRSWKIPGFKDKTWRSAISLLGFIEGAGTYNYKRQNAQSQKDRFLLGTGFGFRFYLMENAHVDFDLGFPIGDPTSLDNDKPRIHLAAKVGF